MLAGQSYFSFDSQLLADRQNAKKLCRIYNEIPEEDTERRSALLRRLFGSCGEDVWVEPRFLCDYGFNIHVGDSFYANHDCIFLDAYEIRIGNRCLIGPRVCLYTVGHPLDAAVRRTGLENGMPILIGDDVWIGGNAILNPGVTVGDRAIIASGSVVTREVPADTVVGGNPARILKHL